MFTMESSMKFHALTICALAALIVGCAATRISPTPSPTSAPQAESSPVVVEPEWVPLTDGAEISYDANYEYHPSEMKLSNGKLLRGNSWNGYLKAYVESFPPEKREPILQGITRHVTDYDKVEGVIRFEPVRYMSGPYSQASHLAVVGTLRPESATAFLKFHYYGDSWLFAKSFKVVTDGVPFQSPKIKFRQDHYGGSVWETAYLNLNKEEYRALAEDIVSSEEAIIRFQGKQYYSDLTVTERMREDIEYMLEALDQIGVE
ncbi:hypothetical protein MDG893_16917 [Marinobacter algicola DG893]|uniref:Lipoprotein n=2 Tax=Marinobacter algicola TaxID=236100 RepID=A6EY08_9GAMM|nr:hypothetical protein MDG893_16917 [Marinobacter algicola DG893]